MARAQLSEEGREYRGYPDPDGEDEVRHPPGAVAVGLPPSDESTCEGRQPSRRVDSGFREDSGEAKIPAELAHASGSQRTFGSIGALTPFSLSRSPLNHSQVFAIPWAPSFSSHPRQWRAMQGLSPFTRLSLSKSSSHQQPSLPPG